MSDVSSIAGSSTGSSRSAGNQSIDAEQPRKKKNKSNFFERFNAKSKDSSSSLGSLRSDAKSDKKRSTLKSTLKSMLKNRNPFTRKTNSAIGNNAAEPKYATMKKGFNRSLVGLHTTQEIEDVKTKVEADERKIETLIVQIDAKEGVIDAAFNKIKEVEGKLRSTIVQLQSYADFSSEIENEDSPIAKFKEKCGSIIELLDKRAKTGRAGALADNSKLSVAIEEELESFAEEHFAEDTTARGQFKLNFNIALNLERNAAYLRNLIQSQRKSIEALKAQLEELTDTRSRNRPQLLRPTTPEERVPAPPPKPIGNKTRPETHGVAFDPNHTDEDGNVKRLSF